MLLFIYLFSSVGVEPTFLTTVPFSLQLQTTELLTQDLCSTVAGIWPWEMELSQEWFHLPVTISGVATVHEGARMDHGKRGEPLDPGILVLQLAF